MIDSAKKKAFERGRRVYAAFPKKLDAEAIRKLIADRGAADEEAKADAECAWDIFFGKLRRAFRIYGCYVITPRYFAERRRRAGDPSASPADYDCLCPVRDHDGVPICRERRTGCRFASMRKLTHHPAESTCNEDHTAWWEIREAAKYLIWREVTLEPEALAALLKDMENEVRRASLRRKRTFGKGFPID